MTRLAAAALLATGALRLAAAGSAEAGRAGQGAAAAGASAAAVVRVAAASDLRFALEEAAAALARGPRPLAVRATYGSSGVLHAQIRQRAPFDVFLSADATYPAELIEHGLAAVADRFPYAVGRLVVWVPAGAALPVERDGLAALAAVRRLAIANPAHAPYGRAAQAALERAGLWAALQPRLLLGDSVTQAAQFVDSGGADAGLIARSLAVAGPMRDRGRTWDVPPALYPPLVQEGLILRTAASRRAAEALRDYLRSDAGRALLERHGFGLPPR